MKILLVDDNIRHRRAGIAQLTAANHEVVAVCDYGEARQRAKAEPFDMALLDLLMPAETTTLGPAAIRDHAGREIGVGFPMILVMALERVPLIVVATDMNHHNHPMSAIVDWFSGETLTICDSRVAIMHAPMQADGTKNWIAILERLQTGK
jgi:CheY-like chemotaxis protein